MSIPLIVILVIVVVLVVAIIGLYNNLVKLRNMVDNAWAQIDVQLQRRLDLIPNLVETVKGYASHERGTLEEVTQARTAVMNAPTPEGKMQADGILTGALKNLFAVAEAYPDLKANANFQQLQAELSNTEDKISYMRQSYNDTVMKFNTAIAALMTLTNQFYDKGVNQAEFRTMLQLLSPFAPHMADELWERFGWEGMASTSAWPAYDESKTVASEVTIAVQVGGKLKTTVTVATDSDQDAVLAAVTAEAKIAKLMEGKELVKVIHVPNKLVNLILKPKA